jgi:multicomponent Na+:H+ antiporter subunit A
MAAVTALGVIGFADAVYFILFSAPDLAMTQFSIETLSVVLIALIIGRLPTYSSEAISRRDRTFDVAFAVGGGVLVTVLLLLTLSVPLDSTLAEYFGDNSYTEALGHNVVNVILVDFRGFDTLGEITVLAIAGLGVFVLSNLKIGRGKGLSDQEEDS